VTLDRGAYKIYVVQDFEQENHNPDLSSMLARVCALPVGRDSSVVSPLAFPIEARPLDYCGVLVVR
jgi:hypothetical protein